MKKLITLAFIGLISLTANSAFAKYCQKHKNIGGVIQSIGKCSECGKMTTSGAFKLCPKCSEKLNKCMVCMAPIGKAKKSVKLAKDGTTIMGNSANAKLQSLCPEKAGLPAVIKDEAVFNKLWKSWKPKGKKPVIDFTKQFVIVATASNGNSAHITTKLEKGNLKVFVAVTEMFGPGFGYTFLIKNRKGISHVNGKALATATKVEYAKAGSRWVGVKNPVPNNVVSPKLSFKGGGIIVSQDELARVWKFWKGSDEKAPKVDFSKNFVIFTTAFGGNIPRVRTKLTNGNMRVLVMTTRMARPGFGYGFLVVKREGVKTVENVKLPAASSQTGMKELKPKNIGIKSNGKTITLYTGQKLIITLAGNMTTGYGWFDATSKKDSKGIVRDGLVEYARPDSPMMGAGGKFIAKFIAKKTGTYKVVLHYKRPWEKKAKPARTYEVTVKIKKNPGLKAPAAVETKEKAIYMIGFIKDDNNKLKDDTFRTKVETDLQAIAKKTGCSIKVKKHLKAINISILVLSGKKAAVKKAVKTLEKLLYVKYVEKDQEVRIMPARPRLPKGGCKIMPFPPKRKAPAKKQPRRLLGAGAPRPQLLGKKAPAIANAPMRAVYSLEFVKGKLYNDKKFAAKVQSDIKRIRKASGSRLRIMKNQPDGKTAIRVEMIGSRKSLEAGLAALKKLKYVKAFVKIPPK